MPNFLILFEFKIEYLIVYKGIFLNHFLGTSDTFTFIRSYLYKIKHEPKRSSINVGTAIVERLEKHPDKNKGAT